MTPEALAVAGTDSTKAARLGGPAIILVNPQLGENIGAAARAMLNCGLTELRLVSPRDGWPNPKASAMASGALDGAVTARLYATAAAAVADLSAVYAATARHRFMTQPLMSAREAAADMHARRDGGARLGVLFGPERSGLTNDDVTLADAIITIALNPAFASLNLGQSVLLVGYEWRQVCDAPPPRRLQDRGSPPASKGELLNFFSRLEAELDDTGFLRIAEKRPSMVRNIRNIFQRAHLTEQELRTLHGVVAALRRPIKPKH